MSNKVIIIGGGASGLMAAITAAERGAQVTVLEQNDRPGRKLLATGNGKCNLTNLDMDLHHYHTDEPELFQAVMGAWTEKDTIDFFRRIGLDMHDRNGWVYPATDQASSVLSLLLMTARENGVKIKTREHVAEIRINHARFRDTANEKKSQPASVQKAQRVKEQNQASACPDTKTHISTKRENGTEIRQYRFEVLTDTWHYDADSVIIACGCPASAVTGSCDDLIRLTAQMGIPCRAFLPALVPLRVKDKGSSAWAGVRAHARVTLLADGQEAASDTGEVQLTQNGISGIPVFQVSRSAVHALQSGKKTVAELNFIPDLTDAETAESLLNKHRSNPGRRIADLLTGMLPDRIIPLFKKEIQTAQNLLDEADDLKKNVDLKGDNADVYLRDSVFLPLAAKIRHYRVEIAGASSLKQAQTCSGGVPFSELTEKLENRKIPGVFFTGETVDVDGECGGYNLQWAWASGHTAGQAAAEKK